MTDTRPAATRATAVKEHAMTDASPEAAKAEALHQSALEALSRKEIETAREGFA